jgi:hypothetical protein
LFDCFSFCGVEQSNVQVAAGDSSVINCLLISAFGVVTCSFTVVSRRLFVVVSCFEMVLD